MSQGGSPVEYETLVKKVNEYRSCHSLHFLTLTALEIYTCPVNRICAIEPPVCCISYTKVVFVYCRITLITLS